MKVTAIFDIGKTNKKFFLFDENFRQVYLSYKKFNELKDEDGFPCDNLPAIEKWIKEELNIVLKNEKLEITGINFSTYGASLVHINKNGKPLTPLYNYLKPFPKKIIKSFYKKYGSKTKIAKETASPPSGMLNSGFQLYWLKHTQPKVFKKIKWSLHLPQYLSYLFTGIPLSDFTSIGCHTSLWSYKKGDYHDWVYKEELDKVLPPIVDRQITINKEFNGNKIKTGIGIHDSSAALLPYLKADKRPFILISTGTWSITLNPFNKKILTNKDLKNDFLNYMQTDGSPVKAARLFLGNEYKLQINSITKYFKKERKYHRQIKFDEKIYLHLKNNFNRHFHFYSIPRTGHQLRKNNFKELENFKIAYHQLMMELMEVQLRSIQRTIGDSKIEKIYVDGGFAENDVFIKLLNINLPDCKLFTTLSPMGSALGAAIAISDMKIGSDFLRKHYSLKEIK